MTKRIEPYHQVKCEKTLRVPAPGVPLFGPRLGAAFTQTKTLALALRLALALGGVVAMGGDAGHSRAQPGTLGIAGPAGHWPRVPRGEPRAVSSGAVAGQGWAHRARRARLARGAQPGSHARLESGPSCPVASEPVRRHQGRASCRAVSV